MPRALRAFAIYVSEVRGNPPGTIHAKLAHMACLLRAIGILIENRQPDIEFVRQTRPCRRVP